MQGNRIPVAEAIREKLPGAIVEHKCGAPFTVRSEVDGKKSATECLPLYALVPACCFSRRVQDCDTKDGRLRRRGVDGGRAAADGEDGALSDGRGGIVTPRCRVTGAATDFAPRILLACLYLGFFCISVL